MTRPTPTQGAQSEAARVPRVSDQRVNSDATHILDYGYFPDAETELSIGYPLDLRDERQASRDKDATIADLEQERDCLVEQVALLQEGALRQELQAIMARHNDVVADLERRLAEANFDRRMLRDSIARVALWNWTEDASNEAVMDFSIMLKVAQVEEREDELIGFEEEVDAANARANDLQTRLTEAEQRAATAERRGFEACRDAAASIAALHYSTRHWQLTVKQVGGKIADAIRALAPAVPQEGETTP